MRLVARITLEGWSLREPFETAREVQHMVPVLTLALTDEQGHGGRAEAAGVDYDAETPASMAAQIEAVAAELHADIPTSALNRLLPAGGARNAVDCALWDLRAKRSGVPAWQAAGLAPLQPVLSAVTIGLGDEATVRRRACALHDQPLIKLKLDATRHRALLHMVREACPRARLIVDANQAWTAALLDQLMPDLLQAGVELIEQPLPRGHDAALQGFASPIPIAADESCTDRASLDALAGRYQAVNIKLDKCGGLSEALALAREAQARGFELMVGNMCGSSLAMAPAFLVAQLARWADLDGPLLQTSDRAHPMTYSEGLVRAPSAALWG